MLLQISLIIFTISYYLPLQTYFETKAVFVADKPALGAIFDKMLFQLEAE